MFSNALAEKKVLVLESYSVKKLLSETKVGTMSSFDLYLIALSMSVN